MRHAAVYEEDDFADDRAELSLGMGTLIGIFFGLALVCGVFFGFGYMIGHRTPGPYVSSDPLYVSPRPAPEPVAPKPSALVAEQPSEASRVVLPVAAEMKKAPAPTQKTPDAPSTPMATLPEGAASKAEAPKPVVLTRTAAPSASAAGSPLTQPQIAPSTTATGTIMVQIAAVKNHSDAEALANAVRKDGFNPTIRTEPQDKLLHVQVGPFASRDEARAMRQRLSSAGYDAFIK